MNELRVTGLYSYPIKSCRGLTLDSAQLTPYGIEHDRSWLVVDNKGRFLTQRRFPKMALIMAQPNPDESLTLTAPGMARFSVDAVSQQTAQVRVWGFEGPALDAGDSASSWLSEYLGYDCRLVTAAPDFNRPVEKHDHLRDSGQILFSDGYPFLLISQASLDELNTRLTTPVAMNRFRPNIVVSGCEAHAEDHWHSLQIGNAIIFHAAERCARCTVPQVDQETGDTGEEPTATLSTYRRADDGDIYFGQNLVHQIKSGILRIGDPVTILA